MEEEEEKKDLKGALVPTLAMLAPLDAYFPLKVEYVASSGAEGADCAPIEIA